MPRKGFTLIELLIVIAIVAILAGVVFVALDPLTRFRDARDAARWTDITAILSAIRVDQVDHGGRYGYGIRHDAAAATSTPSSPFAFMIVNATTTPANCSVTCDSATTNRCANLSQLVERGYLGQLPVSPNGAGSWSLTGNTGFYVQINANNSVTAGACESENASSISVTR
ncbi:MAG: prepilin-type N-terminal cleavage/methylation domain-containing protein [Candidatus Ryanbacteria bacterium]|nr:prepilin-type N-terminal cleavage/methylation domain-containing protein [Candidatus Ryanbacteria bacterium]